MSARHPLNLLARPLTRPALNDDLVRLRELQDQTLRTSTASPGLSAVLGGATIQPGRMQEAFAVWQSLRARAGQADVVASEDLAMLTRLIAEQESSEELVEALSESAYDVAVLPRHRQEQLGRLARRAAAVGDAKRAARVLSWMTPKTADLESDSELRVASAILATLERDASRVLELLGKANDAVGVVYAMTPLVIAFRANALELAGDVDSAAEVLRGLPDPRLLPLVRNAFPAIPLCVQAAERLEALLEGEERERKIAAQQRATDRENHRKTLQALEAVDRASAQAKEQRFQRWGSYLCYTIGGAALLAAALVILSPGDAGDGRTAAAIFFFLFGASFVFGGWRWTSDARPRQPEPSPEEPRGKSIELREWVNERRERDRIAETGIPAMGRLLSIERTGASLNDEPEIVATVEVHHPVLGVYRAEATAYVPLLAIPRAQRGSVVKLRIHAEDQGKIALLF